MPVPNLLPGGRLAQVTVRGAPPAALAGATVTGELDLSTDQVSQLTLSIADPAGQITASRVFARNQPVSYASVPLTSSGQELSDQNGVRTLAVTARSAGAQRARQAYGALVRRHLSPTQYVALGSAAVGLRCYAQPSPVRSSITRSGSSSGQLGESEYDVWQRLAGELGFRCYESLGWVYFGAPSWLAAHLAQVPVAYGADPRVLQQPTLRETIDDPASPITVGLAVADSLGYACTPGNVVILSGVPAPYAGRYLVGGLTVPIDDTQAVQVSLVTPVNPVPSGAS